MTRVLVWKELREQGTSAAAMFVLGLILLVIAYVSGGSIIRSEYAFATLSCMVWVSGLIAGAQPFASERESGTMQWLDSLPLTRGELWRAKAFAAGGIAAAVSLMLFAVTVGVATFWPNETAIDAVLPLLVIAFNGVACGLFGSAVSRTSMAAFGWAIVAQVVTGILFGILAVPVLNRGPTVGGSLLLSALSTALAVAPLVLSARRFGWLDRMRRLAATDLAGPRSDWRAVIWLTWRQGRAVWWGVTLSGLALATFLPEVAPHLWPLFGLALGITAGLGAFGADQDGTAFRFLGDRRVAPGRAWLAKTAVRFSALAIVLIVYFAIGYARMRFVEIGNVNHSNDYLIDETRQRFAPSLLLLGPILGFALGQFIGMMCGKAGVAAVIAALTGAAIGLLWLPCLVIGGVHFWQWFGPPLILVAATRLAFWPWVTGRLSNWRPALGLTAAILLTITGTVAGVAYRLIEAPEPNEPFDVRAFEASLPTPEQNESGRMIWFLVNDMERRLTVPHYRIEQRVVLSNTAAQLLPLAEAAVHDRTWPAKSAQLDTWLDQLLLENDWVGHLRSAVRGPLGVVGPTARPSRTPDYQFGAWATKAGSLILARAVRQTVRGEVESACEDLALVLAFCRQLRNKSAEEQFLAATQLEGHALELLPLWCAKAVDRPELLVRALDILREHESGIPPFADTIKVAYLASVEYRQNRENGIGLQQHSVEEMLAWMALRTPWELDRLQGIQNTFFAGLLRTAETSLPDALRRIAAARGESGGYAWFLECWTPPAGDSADGQAAGRRLKSLLQNSPFGNWPAFANLQIFVEEARVRVELRAALLQLALALHQSKTGKPAADLTALVPDILHALPGDPFGNGPFKYRVSPGERIVWKRRPDGVEERDVASGQGIVWSVGPDLEDNGGHINEAAAWWYPGLRPGGDMLFLAPVVQR